MLMRRSLIGLLPRGSSVLALCLACASPGTRDEAGAGPGAAAPERTAASTLARQAAPAPVASAPPRQPVSLEASEVAAEVDEVTREGESVTGGPGALPALNQLLTTQALLVSLLLTPFAKAPPALPDEPAAPAPPQGALRERGPAATAPALQKLVPSMPRLHAAG